jgi:hypothetical protein
VEVLKEMPPSWITEKMKENEQKKQNALAKRDRDARAKNVSEGKSEL